MEKLKSLRMIEMDNTMPNSAKPKLGQVFLSTLVFLVNLFCNLSLVSYQLEAKFTELLRKHMERTRNWGHGTSPESWPFSCQRLEVDNSEWNFVFFQHSNERVLWQNTGPSRCTFEFWNISIQLSSWVKNPNSQPKLYQEIVIQDAPHMQHASVTVTFSAPKIFPFAKSTHNPPTQPHHPHPPKPPLHLINR